MSTEDAAERTWNNMLETYRKMGLSEEQIDARLVCKTTRARERKGNSDESDK